VIAQILAMNDFRVVERVQSKGRRKRRGKGGFFRPAIRISKAKNRSKPRACMPTARLFLKFASRSVLSACAPIAVEVKLACVRLNLPIAGPPRAACFPVKTPGAAAASCNLPRA